MSTKKEEAEALDRAWQFLLDLGSGQYRVESISKLRSDARQIAKHYPLAISERWEGGWD